MNKIISIIKTEENKYDIIKIITDIETISVGITTYNQCCEFTNLFLTESINDTNLFINFNDDDYSQRELSKIADKYKNKIIKSVSYDQKAVNQIEGSEKNYYGDKIIIAAVLCVEIDNGDKFFIGCSNEHNGYYPHSVVMKYNGEELCLEL